MRFRGSPGINKNRSVLRCYGTVFLMSVLLWHTKRECINLFTTLNVKECRVDVALFSEFPQVRLAQPDSRQKDSIISVLLSRLGAWLLLSRVRRSFNPSSECILRNVLWRTRESCQSRTRDVFSAFGNLNRRKCRESESISGKRFWLFPMGRGGGGDRRCATLRSKRRSPLFQQRSESHLKVTFHGEVTSPPPPASSCLVNRESDLNFVRLNPSEEYPRTLHVQEYRITNKRTITACNLQPETQLDADQSIT